MPHSFDVRFVDNPPIDHVVVAVAPVDAFTGRIISSGIEARIEGLSNHPRRNLSGMLVFVNLPSRSRYRVIVSAEKAGYFDPEPLDFVPPDDDDPEFAKKRLLDVPLHRLPSVAVDADATTVAGLLVRVTQPTPGEAREPVAGARVWAELPMSAFPPGTTSPKHFETRTDKRGAFALRLRLPVDASTAPMSIRFNFQEGADQRDFEASVNEGKFHSFEKPIDLIGTNTPQLLPFGG
jgi:hypothetical protein